MNNFFQNSFLKKIILRSAFNFNSKYSRYQIYSKLNESFVLISKDYTISQEVFVNGEFGLSTFLKAKNILGPEFIIKKFIDIGANIGTISIPVVKRGYATMAYCFEPAPINFNILNANIFINNLSNNIKTYNLALGVESKKELTFELSNDNSGDHRVRVKNEDGIYNELSREIITVKSERFDIILPDLFDKETTLIWIDTQGYEGYILKGAQNVLKYQIPLVVEFWPYGLERSGCLDDFKEACLNYSFFYDLSLLNPVKNILNLESFNNLYNTYINTDGTDILFL